MEPSFRQSMNRLHTWTGVTLAGLCFAIFWMGTLSVFDKEIDRWMMPATRVAAPTGAVSLDRVAPSVEAFAREVGAKSVYLNLPTERVPTFAIYYQDGSGTYHQRQADPTTGAVLPDQGTLAGTGFIFPFHFMLHLKLWNLGYWIVGLAGMAMMALCVSGVIIHRRIFADFFLLRLGKTQRTALDLHNAAGVLGLPFHFVISLSGLVIFIGIFFPGPIDTVFGDRQTFYREVFGNWTRPAAGRPAEGPRASLDAMAQEARSRWNGEDLAFVQIAHIGDVASFVAMRRGREHEIKLNVDVVQFDRGTGAVLASHTGTPVINAHRVIAGLHFIQFRHWTLRWLYFGMGLVGCVLIATGFVFWVESRRKRHEKLGMKGVPLVESLTIGSVTGIVLATLVFLIANRLLPLGSSLGGVGRAGLETGAFYLAWLAAFAHAWLRPGRQAWREQCLAIASLALVALVLNALSTGDHLARSLAHRHLWGVAGVDLMLLAGGLVVLLSAWSLARASIPTTPPTAAQPAPAE